MSPGARAAAWVTAGIAGAVFWAILLNGLAAWLLAVLTLAVTWLVAYSVLIEGEGR
jgi:hypothetical protein